MTEGVDARRMTRVLRLGKSATFEHGNERTPFIDERESRRRSIDKLKNSGRSDH